MSGRSRGSLFLRVFLAMVVLSLAVLPALAQQKKGGGKSRGGVVTRQTGTLSAIDVNASTVKITLTSGETITAPAAKVKVIDWRGGKRTQRTASTLAAGQNVIVKTRTNAKGEVRSVKVKITG